jgi:hypothetical protein
VGSPERSCGAQGVHTRLRGGGANRGRYEVVLPTSIGPVRARFKGQIVLKDVQAPDRYTLVFSGQGGVAGHGKGRHPLRCPRPAPAPPSSSTPRKRVSAARWRRSFAPRGHGGAEDGRGFLRGFREAVAAAPRACAPAQAPAEPVRAGLVQSLVALVSRVFRGRSGGGREQRSR